MPHDINKPETPLYYIAKNGAYSHGHIGTNNQFTSGLANLETFEVYNDYVNKCIEYGLEPMEEVIEE